MTPLSVGRAGSGAESRGSVAGLVPTRSGKQEIHRGQHTLLTSLTAIHGPKPSSNTPSIETNKTIGIVNRPVAEHKRTSASQQQAEPQRSSPELAGNRCLLALSELPNHVLPGQSLACAGTLAREGRNQPQECLQGGGVGPHRLTPPSGLSVEGFREVVQPSVWATGGLPARLLGPRCQETPGESQDTPDKPERSA